MAGPADAHALLRRAAYDAVAGIIAGKRGAVEPCMAHIDEIRAALDAALMEALRGLCREGFLSASPDINRKPMFRTIKDLAG